MSEHAEHPPAPAPEAEKSPAPAKMPAFKRLILSLSGITMPIMVGFVLICTILIVAGFAGGLLLGIRKGKASEEMLRVQIKNVITQNNKLHEEHEKLEKKLEDAKSVNEAQQADLRVAQDTAKQLQLEKDALEKFLNEIKEKLVSGAPGKPQEKPTGYKLKFSDKECDPGNRTIKNKDDVGCMDLKGAIDSMNESYNAKKAEAKKAAPAPAKQEAPKADSHHH
ncbi:hypothetical protein KSF73_00140 [Burkholderiaceae bacterium DAT-1]|nr:hypothetical protein [Burkholderiaceae bacterium DAT-1]